MYAIYKKEIKSYFLSPLGYVFLGGFTLVTALFFAIYNLLHGIGDISYVFSNITLLLVFLVPILTMRSVADERGKKTDRLLLTSPVNVSEIILGKFFAACTVLGTALIITLIYPVILAFYTKTDWGKILGTYIGFFLMGATFISIGIFISSLTENVIMSAVLSFIILFVFYIMDWIAYSVSNNIIKKAAEFLSVTSRYTNLSLGIIDITSVIYYLSIQAIFGVLAAYNIEKRRYIK